ncbi:MAG TPA: permease-like cell division protein FtsX [Actinomycetota bacterium]|nr:permease-like cell division protein FtsX [Actinomycetota bacterium]
MKLGYFLRETVTNLRRNFLMTVAAISTVAISLLLLGGVQILGLVVNRMTDEWEAKVEVSVYMRDDASPNEEQALASDLTKMNEVQDVTYVSKEQAFAEFKEQYPDLWEGLPPDALPASYRVKLLDANDAVEVAARVEGAPGVDEVKFGGDVIKTLLQVNTLLRSVTFVMSVILMIAAGALIANTIRLAIYARRDEIGIMKLVGATNWFIRIPFMLEGLFAALVGAASAIGIVLGANWLLFSRIGRAIPLLDDVLRFSGGELMGVTFVLIGVGALVGLIGSGLALRRFLEV